MPQFLTTDEIRRRWIEFFIKERHQRLSSDSLVPRNDPSVLFSGAGMNQFKDHFLGHAKLDHPTQRAVTVQKCLRTADIDNVGRTPNHHTFFEMLGNFSFGDYFKKEAIEWAWKFCTDSEIGLGLEKDRLSVTIFGGDLKLGIAKDIESQNYWQINAPELRNQDGSWRIYEYGEHDNFWPADAPSQGPNGVCGPCSEIYYDTKPELGAPERVANSRDPYRYVEIWNLVFTQFSRVGVGKLEPLSQKNIDTGAGLERMARVIQQKQSNYEIDLLFPIVQEVAKLANKSYGQRDDDDRRMRRITDHARAAVFCVADGVAPKNEGRNYVVRRLIRRAILDGREIGITASFLGQVAKVVIKQMGTGYPELPPREHALTRLIEEEETVFSRTLLQAQRQFEDLAATLIRQKKTQIPGAEAFRLWDTFGLPIEIVTELAQSRELTVDRIGYEAAYENAIKRSQAGSTMSKEIFAVGPMAELKKRFAGKATEFVGYETTKISEAKVLAIIQRETLVDSAQPGDVLILLDRTPFYGESGGQVGDQGHLFASTQNVPPLPGLHAHVVLDTQRQENLILHRVSIISLFAPIKVGDLQAAFVDSDRRLLTNSNHSATHLLHFALRNILGAHVEQRGSLVASDRLRFDFTHFEQITHEQIARIEAVVNDLIQNNAPIKTETTTPSEAKARGALALFGEKYGERVRLVAMGPSTELCGGTHCCATGQIGYFRIVSESAIAAGVRRIEAITGADAVADARRADEWLAKLALQLKTNKDMLPERIKALQEEKSALERELESLRKKNANAVASDLLSQIKNIAGVKLLVSAIDGADQTSLRAMLDSIRKTLNEGAVVLGGVHDGKVALLTSLSPDIVKRGGHAGNLLKELALKVGGKGGGKSDMAQGGGTDVAKLPEALAEAEALLAKMLKY
ncbi:MAG: alanine--tRNA ligase [Planctomycetota bacterium]